MRKFRRAQAQNQASIEKHLVANNVESSSSDDENEEVLETAVEKVLSTYQREGGDVNKTSSYLTETLQSGGAVCLICISSVKKTDAVCIEIFDFILFVLQMYELTYFIRFGAVLNVTRFYIYHVFNTGCEIV